MSRISANPVSYLISTTACINRFKTIFLMIMSFQNGRFTLNKTLPFDLHNYHVKFDQERHCTLLLALLMRLRITVAYLGHVL